MGAGSLFAGALRSPRFQMTAWAEQTGQSSVAAAGIATDMPWQRRDKPALSATTTHLDWCKSYCYSPHILRTSEGYRMYYIGKTGGSLHVRDLMGFVLGMAWPRPRMACIGSRRAMRPC